VAQNGSGNDNDDGDEENENGNAVHAVHEEDVDVFRVFFISFAQIKVP